MRFLLRAAAIALVLLPVACGGGSDEAAQDDNVPTTTQADGEAAACWEDAAKLYKAASDKALPLLRDDPPDLVDRYNQLLADVGPTLTEDFKKSFDRLFETLEDVADGGNAFNKLYADARAKEKCTGTSAGAAQADACWEDVARAYEEASGRASVAVNGELGRMFDGIRTSIDAAERHDSAGVRRGTRELHAAFDRLKPEAGRYARAQGNAERLYEDCLAAA